MSRRTRKRFLRRLEMFFWLVAAVALGVYAFVYFDRSAYQAYENWSFQRQLKNHHAPVTPEPKPPAQPERNPARPSIADGTLLGRVEIPRIGLHAMVVEGTTETALRRAVGHVEGTALPGQPGNVGLAGHRDTFFRGLRRLRKHDRIRVTTLDGEYDYLVDSIQVVEPDDVQVLDATARPTLTLVTCFPFHYIGPAPHRFIVRAHAIGRR